MKEREVITISLEEYKELLIIKGKYEELKSFYTSYNPYNTKITYRKYCGLDDDNESYNVSCESEG